MRLQVSLKTGILLMIYEGCPRCACLQVLLTMARIEAVIAGWVRRTTTPTRMTLIQGKAVTTGAGTMAQNRISAAVGRLVRARMKMMTMVLAGLPSFLRHKIAWTMMTP